jgi:hypothetical protein
MIFPLTGNRFEHQFGIRALPPSESIFLRTDQYADEIAEKKRLISDDHSNYVAVLPQAEQALLETSVLILDHADAALEFIDAALSVQEDLVICSGDSSGGFPIIAGVVCFPSGWSIAEKIGMPIQAVHAPVPKFDETMGRSTASLLDRLRVGRPVWRTNWGVRCSGELDQSPKHRNRFSIAANAVDSSSAGDQCHFRVERQTLSRLPISGDILFTIHTMQQPIAELDQDQQNTLLAWLQTCPAETLRYKGIDLFSEPLQTWLKNNTRH